MRDYIVFIVCVFIKEIYVFISSFSGAFIILSLKIFLRFATIK